MLLFSRSMTMVDPEEAVEELDLTKHEVNLYKSFK